MRFIPLFSLVSLLASPALLCQTPTQDSARTRAVAELMAIFDETGSGRGAAAAERRSALFSEKAVFINAFGVRVEGGDSLANFWRRVYTSGSFAVSKVERLDRQQRDLGPDLVLVDHVERITGQRNPDTGSELPPRTAHITLLLQRQATGEWRIVYYRAGDVRDWPAR
jgi:ketosteroid isomerase-like protein